MREAVVPSNSSYEPEVHLSVGDIKDNDRKKPSFLGLNKGVKDRCIPKRGDYMPGSYRGGYICPVAAILSYMIHCSVMARGKQSPFFCF